MCCILTRTTREKRETKTKVLRKFFRYYCIYYKWLLQNSSTEFRWTGDELELFLHCCAESKIHKQYQ